MKNAGYKATVVFLLLIIVIQGIFMFKAKPKKKIEVLPKVKGVIAIVIDDWGYNLNNIAIAEQLNYPITASILPHLNYSSRVSRELHNRGFEIILHLPMEPFERVNLEKNTIRVGMSPASIKNIITDDLATIAYAKGISNHMGSKATSDRKTMEVVFEALKEGHLYFFDSYVTAKSLAFKLAEQVGVKAAKRDVFLDNETNPAYIKTQLHRLKMKAKSTGYAIGIGHDRRNTFLVLKEIMPQIEKEGYRFVFLSELVK